MRIAICDDEARCLEQVTAIAGQYVRDRKDKKITVSTFSHADDLLEEAEKIGGFDIYILDIVMPDMNGIQLGMQLRDMGYDGKIIYLTSSEEYALDSFKVRALNYIIKPITEKDFYAAVDEAVELLYEKKEKHILVKAKERSVKLPLDSIMYAELSKRVVTYYLENGTAVESTTLRTTFTDAVAELLADRRFVLCGAGMAVNLDHVTSVEGEAVTLGENHRIFLAKKTCRELRMSWSKYLFEGAGV